MLKECAFWGGVDYSCKRRVSKKGNSEEFTMGLLWKGMWREFEIRSREGGRKPTRGR